MPETKLEPRTPRAEPAPQQPKSHGLALKDRRHLAVTGVSRVISCDENTAVLETPLGNLTIGGQELHIAIVNGLIHAKELIADIEAGKRFYHLVEVMTCQGGCVGGAGQPYGLTAVKRKRKQGLYDTDASALFKRAEKNPIVTTLLDKYGEERCHELLHVHYDA